MSEGCYDLNFSVQRTVAPQQPLDTMLLIAQQPLRDLRSGCFQDSGQLAAAGLVLLRKEADRAGAYRPGDRRP